MALAVYGTRAAGGPGAAEHMNPVGSQLLRDMTAKIERLRAELRAAQAKIADLERDHPHVAGQ